MMLYRSLYSSLSAADHPHHDYASGLAFVGPQKYGCYLKITITNSY